MRTSTHHEDPKDFADSEFRGYAKSLGTSEMYAHTTYDPALTAGDPQCVCAPGNCTCKPACPCMCCWGNTPGGRTNIIQYNEKGVLEQGMMHMVSMTSHAGLGSDHDGYARGIYTEHYEMDSLKD